MRYTAKQYAAALYEAVKNKPREAREAALKNFISLLRKNHDTGRLEAILRETEGIYFKKNGINRIKVESAAPLNPGVKKEISRLAGEKTYLRESVKPELLAGIRILIGDELLIDAAGESILRRLFPNP